MRFIIKNLIIGPDEPPEYVRFGTTSDAAITLDANQAKRFSREEAEEWVHGYEDSYELVPTYSVS